MKHKKRALFQSLISLLLCFSMLVGTTFAWFTDSVSSGWNTIAAGTLDVEMEYRDANGNWLPVNEATEVLDRTALWEPGYTEVAYLRITNAGKLALKYALGIRAVSETGSVNADGQAFLLSNYIQFGVVESRTEQPAFATRTEARNALTQSQPMSQGLTAYDTLLPEENLDVRYATLVVYMPEEVGNAANYATGQLPPQIQLGIELVATQAEYESDAFGKGYDAAADIPGFSFPNILFGGSVSAGVTPGEDNKVTENVTIPGSNMNAVVPAGVLLDEQTDKLTLEIAPVAESQANVTLGENEEALSLDVHIQGVAAGNTQPMEITMKGAAAKGLNNGNLKLYHVETDAEGNKTTVEMTRVETFDAHNQFKYDPNTGDIVLYMATFSEVAMVADTENAWKGNFDYSWYADNKKDADGAYIITNADQLAAFGAIVGGMKKVTGKNENGYTYSDEAIQDSFEGKTVKLIADIDLDATAGKIFYPIGYNSSDGKYEKTGEAVTTGFYTFEGTFDGKGHTISNFYQNTWEMKGDNNYYDATLQYYRDGMGLFGKVYGGTVKNLTVENFKSDGEYTTTGCIAAYADGATFENIAIVDCNPRVYNTGNGGIVGCVGWYAKEADLKTTFKNITVDKTNKISALWESYDVACGGIVGQYYPTSGQSSAGNPKNAGVHFENCNMAAQMDVYNDVCGNYQYYAYRYAGMMIGSIRENLPADENGHVYPDMTGISAKNCTVNFGDWNDYYYCEFTGNGHPSYSGPNDYKFSRVDKSELTFKDDGTVTCKHSHSEVEDNRAIYLPFHQLFTGYGWGVTSKGLDDFDGITVQIRESQQNQSVGKFKTKFTGDFLYRVGNLNEIKISSLFSAIEEDKINDSGVYVRIDKLYEDANVTCAFTPAETGKEWTEGTLKFDGTGVVDIVIQDYDYCTPTILHLEVVDAVNATSATSATENNVVLLNDCGFSSLEVSGGYTLYGNGFTMTCANDSASLSFGQFVDLNNGALDNVQIVCPNYDYAALYSSQLKGKENRSETTNGTERYFNAKSAVLATGNSQILNSRISGGRAALYASSGNIVVDNSRLELGAVATVIISSANSFIFKDATLVQKPTASTYDSNKTLMGMSVLYMCDTDGNATPTTIEGNFVQNAWANATYSDYMPEGTSSIASTVLNKKNCTHDINGVNSVNLGFAYMSEGKSVGLPQNITDKRSNKDSVPYAYEPVQATVYESGLSVKIDTYVYCYQNTNGTDDSYKTDTDYKPNEQSDIVTVSYSDTKEGLTTGKSYGTNGWIYELNVDLDKLSGYALDFSKLAMTVNGMDLADYKVNNDAKPTSPVKVLAGGTNYTLSATVDGKTYTVNLVVTGVETTKDAPSLIDKIGGSKIIADNVSWGTSKCVVRTADDNKTNYTVTAPVLQGLIVRYWSVRQGKYEELDLTTLVTSDSQSLNGTNNYWEYNDPNGDFTLKITNTAYVHDGNKIYAMPVAHNKTLYFVSTSADGLVSTGSGARVLKMKYEFRDNNNGELIFEHQWSQAYDKNNTLNYKDLTGIKDGCVTVGTLITMADGTQKPVEELMVGDMLLAFNHITGKLEAAPLIFNTHSGDEYDYYDVLNLQFSNGAEVEVVESHGFFDVTLMKYVYIDYDNYTDFIGHQFWSNGEKVTLANAFIEEEYTAIYCPVTYFHMNSFANGMLNTPSIPGDITGLVNYFEYDSDLKYNEEAMRKDIEKYGLYTYADFSDYISEAAYNSSPAVHLKVAVGKGMITFEQILDVIEYLLAGSLID